MKDTIENLDYHKEGIVIEDANGFMVKLKSTYYRMWKSLRDFLGYLQNLKEINEYLKVKEFPIKEHTDPRAQEEAKKITDFMVELAKEGKIKKDMNILNIQDMYYNKK